MNEEGCGGQAAAATSAREVRQAKGRSSAGHGRYAIDRHRQEIYAGDTAIKQCDRYDEGEACPEQYGRHAGKYDELGTSHINKSEQAILNLDGVKPWSKAMTERDKSKDSEGTGREAEPITKLQGMMSLPGTHERIVHVNTWTDTGTETEA